MEEIKKKQEIPIREVGSFFETDENGYLINPASADKIQEEWKPVIGDIVDEYKKQYGDQLHTVYVRGSVGKGEAISGISDVDTLAYVDVPKENIKTDWMDGAEREIMVRYPFVQGVELRVAPIQSASKDRLLILQSACVYGEDIGLKMPKIKVGRETLGHVYSFPKKLAWFDEWILKSHTSEEIQRACTWLMKRFLRTGLELTMERAGKYTRDLYPSYTIFSEYYPEKEKDMREVLNLAINPTDDVEVIKKIRNDFGMWIEEQTKGYRV